MRIFTIILVENLALACVGGLAGVPLATLAAGPLAQASRLSPSLAMRPV